MGAKGVRPWHSRSGQRRRWEARLADAVGKWPGDRAWYDITEYERDNLLHEVMWTNEILRRRTAQFMRPMLNGTWMGEEGRNGEGRRRRRQMGGRR